MSNKDAERAAAKWDKAWQRYITALQLFDDAMHGGNKVKAHATRRAAIRARHALKRVADSLGVESPV
jgi:hypothetical protein